MRLLQKFLLFCFFSFSFGEDFTLCNLETDDILRMSAIKEKCESKGGKDAFEKLKTAEEHLRVCLMEMNFSDNCTSIEHHQADRCIEIYLKTLSNCLEGSRIQSFKSTWEFIKQLADSGCKNTKLLKGFATDGGVKCVKQQREHIYNCINNHPGELLEKSTSDIDQLELCFTKELKKCDNNILLNITNKMFANVKQENISGEKKHHIITRELRDFHRLEMVKVEKVMKKKCQINAPLHTFKVLKKRYNQTEDCLKTKQILSRSGYHGWKRTLKHCTRRLIPVIKKCLTTHEKDYPDFILKVINLWSKISFDLQKEFENEKFGEKHMTKCFQTKQSQFVHNMQKCPILAEWSTNIDEFFDKSNICRHLNTQISCLFFVLKTTCKDPYEQLKKIKKNYETSFKNVCNGIKY